jgi:hypothetical protein
MAVVTAVHQHVVAATSTTCRKGAAGAVGTTTTTTTIVHRHLMVMNALYAKSASSSGTRQIDVGTGLMRTMCHMRS